MRDTDLAKKSMVKISFRENGEWREVRIEKHTCVHFFDNDNNDYEIRADRFGGIDIIAVDGKISIEPCMSNNITIKTV